MRLLGDALYDLVDGGGSFGLGSPLGRHEASGRGLLFHKMLLLNFENNHLSFLIIYSSLPFFTSVL